MHAPDVLGFVAGVLTTAANVPQVVKTWKTKSGEGLSFRMLLALLVGLILWTIYGIVIKSWPVIVTELVALLLVLALFVMKFQYDRAPTKD